MLARLDKQVEKRLPARKGEEVLATLLDPMTKPFAKKWLGGDIFEDAKSELRRKHRDLYIKIYSSGLSNEESPGDDVQEDNNLEDPAFDEYANDEDALDLTAGDDGEGAVNLEREADEVFDRWMKHVTTFNDYLYKGAKEIKNVNNCGPNELIDKFDTQKFFREYGRQNFLAIVILARMYFSRFETGSEQERVFSSARLAMGKDQTNMGFEMFKMRTLLSHNKDLIRAGIIKI